MRVIRCPKCNESLPAWAHYCGTCGESLASPTQESLLARGSEVLKNQNARALSNRLSDPQVPHSFVIEADGREQMELSPIEQEDISNQRIMEDVVVPLAGTRSQEQEDISIQRIMEGLWEPPTPTGASTNGDGVHTQEHDELEDTIEDAWHSRTNWHKDVIAGSAIIDRPAGGETPPGLLIPPSRLLARRRMPRGMLFWVSMLLLFGLVMGGLFGVVITLGRGVFSPPLPHHAGLSLQVSPSSIALGALISLYGSNFTPKGRIGLSYDANIPIIDTDGDSVILADKNGNFTDTAIVEPEWLAGPHIIHAEDATLHKIASFTVMVTGQSPSLRPAHLRLSANTIDLGSGDQATNSMQTLTLMNVGGGLVTWQAAVTQPWVMASPKNGTFANNQSVQVVIAANRSNLAPGSYTASVIFTSNAGQIDLPVKMEVTPLRPGYQPILQLTPATLSFSASDGGTNPPGQVVTISNPGTQSLQWSATNVIKDAPDWLSISPRSGSVTQGASEAVTIGANINALLPGVYNSLVTFTSQGSGAVAGSPQSVYVSLTVLPQCQLQVSPGALSFAGVHSQNNEFSTRIDTRSASYAEGATVDLSVPQGCSTPLNWSATTTTDNGGRWLNIDGQGSANGTTPAHPLVSVNITGLAPRTYTGAVVFGSSVGTQTLPVTLTIGQAATPIIFTTPAAMSFSAVAGQFSSDKQTITITNAGGGTLTWNATAATDVGGSWLAITPATGTLPAHQSASVTVSATLLSSLTPNLYNGTITITGLDSAGNPASGSPQQIPVTFRVNVLAQTTFSVGPSSLVFNVTGGVTSKSLAISNTGSASLMWQATLATNAPPFVSLSASPNNILAGGASADVRVTVDVTGLTGGTTYTTTVVVRAIDPGTGAEVSGSPATIPITIHVTSPLPPVSSTIQVSSTHLFFRATSGTASTPQSVIITNPGADPVTWTASVPADALWLQVSPASNSDAPGASSTLTFTADATGLQPGVYSTTVTITPTINRGATGTPIQVTVRLRVSAPVPTPLSPSTPAAPTTVPATPAPAPTPATPTPTSIPAAPTTVLVTPTPTPRAEASSPTPLPSTPAPTTATTTTFPAPTATHCRHRQALQCEPATTTTAAPTGLP
jgi:hypothetical protein